MVDVDFENKYLEDLKGKTYNNKVKYDIAKFLNENKNKFKGVQSPLGEVASVVNHSAEGEIKEVGGSKPDDLVCEAYLDWFASMFNSPSTALRTFDLIDESSVTNSLYWWYGGTSTAYDMWNNSNNLRVVGMYIQTGEGTTTPARTDRVIETPHSTSPESGKKGVSTGAWNNTLGTATTNITHVTGGSGTVNEAVLYHRMVTAGGGGSLSYLICHDAITPAVPFSMGQTITTEYVFTFGQVI